MHGRRAFIGWRTRGHGPRSCSALGKVAVATGAGLGGVGVLGALGDALDVMTNRQVAWIVTTATVLLAAVGVVLFVTRSVLGITRAEAVAARSALGVLLHRVAEHASPGPPGDGTGGSPQQPAVAP